MNTGPKIAVVGSLNIDCTHLVERIPRPGETITSRAVETCFGGKGANQALAALRAGADVSLIGCVGHDDGGERYIAALKDEGMDTSAISTTTDQATGSATIVVDDHGDNTIIVNPGANHRLTPDLVDRHRHVITAAGILLVQLEVPLESVRRACEIAASAATRVILNPSPWHPDFTACGLRPDVLVVNSREAAACAGVSEDALDHLDAGLLEEHDWNVLVITRGAGPTRYLCRDAVFEASPPTVTPVDTVAAGDSFTGALAVALAGNKPPAEALAFANAAGALATQVRGAQPSIPGRKAIEDALAPRTA